MTAMKVQQTRDERTSVDSEDVVATSTAGVMDTMEVQDLAASDTGKPTSVLQGRAGLNDPGIVNALVILQAAGETAFESNKLRPLVAIPTADLISHTSFKSGSKFVLRIVPTQDNKTKDKNALNQINNDQALYFDKASLQTTSEVHEERYQLFEAFDSETLFLFGERPKIWSFQFIVTNANKPRVPVALTVAGAEQALEEFMRRWNMDFTDELLRRYDKYYRGSAALKLRARTYMSYEDVLIEATLVGMVASRNSSVPGAANVGLTFVVHQRQFMGESLTFGADATLKSLLASEDQRLLVSRQIRATSIIPSKKTSDQLLAEYASNQARAQESQQAATEIQNEANAVTAAGAEAEQNFDALAEAQVELDAEIAAETDPEQKAILTAAREDIHGQLVAAAALVQESEQAAGTRNADLAAATKENEIAINRQETSEAQLKANPDGDLTKTTQALAFTVTLMSSIAADGTIPRARRVQDWSAPSATAANAIASGASPEAMGATVVGDQIFAVGSAQFVALSSFPDGFTTTTSQGHS